MAVTGGKWSTQADLSLAFATVEDMTKDDIPSGAINGSGTNGTVGHYCYFDLNNDQIANDTQPFDWVVNADFTVVLNATKGNLEPVDGTTLDVSIIGSVDGTNYTELAAKTDCLQDSDGTIDTTIRSFVYNYDSKGRMPYMAIRIDANQDTPSAFYINVIPH